MAWTIPPAMRAILSSDPLWHQREQLEMQQRELNAARVLRNAVACVALLTYMLDVHTWAMLFPALTSLLFSYGCVRQRRRVDEAEAELNEGKLAEALGVLPHPLIHHALSPFEPVVIRR